MWSREEEGRPAGEQPRRGKRRAALLAAGLGLLALGAAARLGLAAREKSAAAAGATAQGLAISSALDRLSARLVESEAAAGRFQQSAEAEHADAQGEAAEATRPVLRELERLVPDGSQADAARVLLELLVAEKVGADREAIRTRQGEAGATASPPDLVRLLGERVRSTAAEVDRQTRLATESRTAELRTALGEDLGWLLAALAAVLAAFGVAIAVALSSRGAPDRALYLDPDEPPAVAPPLLQDLLDSLTDGVLVVDAHGKLVATSPAASAILDVDGRGAAARRRGPRGLYLPSDDAPLPSVRNPLVRAIAGEKVEGAEMSVGRPSDPESRRVVLSARPFRDPDGTRRGAAVVLRDVTDQRRAEAELKKAEALVAQAAGERGRLLEEALAEERGRLEEARRSAEAERARVESALQRVEGELRKAEGEGRRIEAALRRSEARIVGLFEGLPVPLLAVGGDGRVRRANRAAGDLLGASPAELAGSPLSGRLETAGAGDASRGRIAAGPSAGTPVRVGTATIPDLAEGSVEVLALLPEPAPGASPGRPEAAPASRVSGPPEVSATAAAPPTPDEWDAAGSLLGQVLEAITTGVVLADQDGRIRFANETGRRLWPGDDATRRGGEAPLARWADTGEPVAAAEWGAAGVLGGGPPLVDRAVELPGEEGHPRTIRSSVLPVRVEGRAMGVMILLDDVTEERRLQDDRRRLRARSAALVDKLRDVRLALGALVTRFPLCPSCAGDRAGPGFWARMSRAVEEASCPECARLKAGRGRRTLSEADGEAEGDAVVQASER